MTEEPSHCCITLGWLQVFTDPAPSIYQALDTSLSLYNKFFFYNKFYEVYTALMLQMTKLRFQEVICPGLHRYNKAESIIQIQV